MTTLRVQLGNCFGIRSLEHDFDFGPDNDPGRTAPKAYAIYAPNGLMKSSFAKTFDALSSGENPKEERYGRTTTCSVTVDGIPIDPDSIYVLRAEIDIKSERQAVSDILVNPQQKSRYDQLVFDLERIKGKLIRVLQKRSRVKANDVERTLVADFGELSFPEGVAKAKQSTLVRDLGAFEYASIFDAKALEVLNSREFLEHARDFQSRYRALFGALGTIYQRGVFNPAGADATFAALEKNGYFAGGHRVHLKGDAVSLDRDALEERRKALHAHIDGDENLKALRTNLARNAGAQAIATMIENLSADDVDYFLDMVQPSRQVQFRRDLWVHYLNSCPEADEYLRDYESSRSEIREIEAAAAIVAPRWQEAIDRFNDRFVDMPFTLSVANPKEAALGREKARLEFTFRDGDDVLRCSRDEVATLSQGEQRALYLLSFIFEVEARKASGRSTLYVIDDVADSFDYKNKYAIVQYLEDLGKSQDCSQIILTHNYDFFRSIANTFVPRDRCLMANRVEEAIRLVKADGLKNYLTGVLKQRVPSSVSALCASIPFSRNLLEYTKGSKDPDYLTLTSMLHWKQNTSSITVGNYFQIYNDLFGAHLDVSDSRMLVEVLEEAAESICEATVHAGLELEDKIALSMAIRISAERHLTERIRFVKGDPNYWCQTSNQFGALLGEYEAHATDAERRVLRKIRVTVSSNIHLNSFMYEPILDLSLDHLVRLYGEAKDLETLKA